MREKLIRCLKYCATTTDGDHHCGGCERWEYDCGSSHCVDDLMLQAAEALEQQKWIPVTERLPSKNMKCLCSYVFSENTEFHFEQVLYYIATCENPHFQHEGELGLKVTHWMPLPEPPKGE